MGAAPATAGATNRGSRRARERLDRRRRRLRLLRVELGESRHVLDRGEPLAAVARPAGRGRSRGRGERERAGLRFRRLRRRPAAAPDGLRSRAGTLAPRRPASGRSRGGGGGCRERRRLRGGRRRRPPRARPRRTGTRPPNRTLVASAWADTARTSCRSRDGRSDLRAWRPDRGLRHQRCPARGLPTGNPNLVSPSARAAASRRHRRRRRLGPDRLRRRRGACGHDRERLRLHPGRPAAGSDWPTYQRRVTDSASSPTATASTPSRAARSRA